MRNKSSKSSFRFYQDKIVKVKKTLILYIIQNKENLFLITNDPFNTINFEKERNRIDRLFKNNGIYDFSK